jgi:O-antigen/teichoic acid export membrane protein
LVLGLLLGDIVNRTLAHYAFYDRETKAKLKEATSAEGWNTIKTLAPNSLKIGLTALSQFLRNQSIVLIAPFYLSLSQIAEFGISKQLSALITSLGLIWYNTYYSKTSQYRVRDDIDGVKRLYIKGTLNLILMFVIGGSLLLMFGNDVLLLIKSKTLLLCSGYLFLMLLFSFLDARQIMANGNLIAKNEVPFFKADIISGVSSVLLLLLMFNFTSLGVLSLILATGLVLCAYMSWKIPLTLAKEIKLTLKDYKKVILSYLAMLKK